MKAVQEYNVQERVGVQGWGGYVTGMIIGVDWIYHSRNYEHTWGYLIKFDEGMSNPFTMSFIPQGYLRKLNEK